MYIAILFSIISNGRFNQLVSLYIILVYTTDSDHCDDQWHEELAVEDTSDVDRYLFACDPPPFCERGASPRMTAPTLYVIHADYKYCYENELFEEDSSDSEMEWSS